MWKTIKQFFVSDTGLLYVLLVSLTAVLLLSLFGINPGFGEKTAFGRLYDNKTITASLLLILAAGSVRLHTAKPTERRKISLVFAGMLWGIGMASALAFDPVLFLMLSSAAVSLYRSDKKDPT